MRFPAAALLVLALCAPASAHGQDANAERTATYAVDRTHDDHLRAGAWTLILGYVVNAPIGLLTSFILFFESPQPCYETICGIWETYGLSFIPVVGPAIWGALAFDTSGNPGALIGVLVSAVQATGLGLLIGGAVRASAQPRITPMITATAGGAQLALSF